MFLNSQEVAYKFIDINTTRRMKYNKFSVPNIHNMSKLNIIVYFWFRQLQELDLVSTTTYNHLLLVWLITRQYLHVDKFNSRLVKGIRYFRYVFRTMNQLQNIFFFIDFLVNSLLKVIMRGTFKLIDTYNNTGLFILDDLNPFSNIRISGSLYLPTVSDRMYLRFYSSSQYIPMKNELNLYKIKKK